jgi:hypothetical protein
MIVKEKTSESGHWYSKDGSPAYTTVGANGNERATTLRDARKLGLLPSVTTIIGLLSKAGLDTWKQQQVLLAALTLPRIDGEPEQEWLARVMQDSKETGRKAAERGEAIHAIIQTFYENVYMPELPPYVKIVEAAINEHFGPRLWLSERSFAHPDGYGGKCDLMSRSDYASHWDGAVVDFKTKDTSLDKAEVYFEHIMQLAAYRQGLEVPKAKAAICFVNGTTNEVKVVGVSEEDLQKGWECYSCLLKFYKIRNNI